MNAHLSQLKSITSLFANFSPNFHLVIRIHNYQVSVTMNIFNIKFMMHITDHIMQIKNHQLMATAKSIKAIIN